MSEYKHILKSGPSPVFTNLKKIVTYAGPRCKSSNLTGGRFASDSVSDGDGNCS